MVRDESSQAISWSSSRASLERWCAARMRMTPSTIINTRKPTHTTIITVTAWPTTIGDKRLFTAKQTLSLLVCYMYCVNCYAFIKHLLDEVRVNVSPASSPVSKKPPDDLILASFMSTLCWWTWAWAACWFWPLAWSLLDPCWVPCWACASVAFGCITVNVCM